MFPLLCPPLPTTWSVGSKFTLQWQEFGAKHSRWPVLLPLLGRLAAFRPVSGRRPFSNISSPNLTNTPAIDAHYNGITPIVGNSIVEENNVGREGFPNLGRHHGDSYHLRFSSLAKLTRWRISSVETICFRGSINFVQLKQSVNISGSLTRVCRNV